MPYDPDDMLRFAASTAGRSVSDIADETRWRTALGRAYYACYLVARDQLFGPDGRPTANQLGKFPRQKKGRHPGSHEEVGLAIGVHPGLDPAKRKRQKDWLESLKALRIAADYRRDDSHSSVKALLRQYDAAGWEDLATEGLTLASQLLPELRSLNRFP